MKGIFRLVKKIGVKKLVARVLKGYKPDTATISKGNPPNTELRLVFVFKHWTPTTELIYNFYQRKTVRSVLNGVARPTRIVSLIINSLDITTKLIDHRIAVINCPDSEQLTKTLRQQQPDIVFFIEQPVCIPPINGVRIYQKVRLNNVKGNVRMMGFKG